MGEWVLLVLSQQRKMKKQGKVKREKEKDRVQKERVSVGENNE